MSAVAGPATTGTPTGTPCTTDSFTFKTLEYSPFDGAGMLYSGPALVSTKCVGMYKGNDSGYLSTPNPNIGQLNDGLLNGQGGILNPQWFQPAGELPQSPMQDLDKDGIFTDPGWIYLGKVSNTSSTGNSFVMDGYDLPIAIDSILNVKMSCGANCTTGQWSLETYPNIVEDVRNVLGRSIFDHLAFVIHAGNRFAVYDFDFNLISGSLPGFDFNSAYSLSGEWNTLDFMNPTGTSAQNFSHISVWARDPVAANDVPEPGSLALVALGLLVLGYSRKS